MEKIWRVENLEGKSERSVSLMVFLNLMTKFWSISREMVEVGLVKWLKFKLLGSLNAK